MLKISEAIETLPHPHPNNVVYCPFIGAKWPLSLGKKLNEKTNLRNQPYH